MPVLPAPTLSFPAYVTRVLQLVKMAISPSGWESVRTGDSSPHRPPSLGRSSSPMARLSWRAAPKDLTRLLALPTPSTKTADYKRLLCVRLELCPFRPQNLSTPKIHPKTPNSIIPNEIINLQKRSVSFTQPVKIELEDKKKSPQPPGSGLFHCLKKGDPITRSVPLF